MYPRLRRFLLVIGIIGATGAWFYVSLEPVLSVEVTDFEWMQHHERGYSELARAFRQLPINEYMCAGAEKAGKSLVAARQRAGIPGRNDVRIVEALVPPDGEGASFPSRHKVRDTALLIRVATPIIIVISGIILIAGRAILSIVFVHSGS